LIQINARAEKISYDALDSPIPAADQVGPFDPAAGSLRTSRLFPFHAMIIAWAAELTTAPGVYEMTMMPCAPPLLNMTPV
jgi:hypothetical protein